MARRGSERLPDSRRALIGTYAALDADLRADLKILGVEFPEGADPYDQLSSAATDWEDGPADIPRVQLAQAAIEVLSSPIQNQADPRNVLQPVLEKLVDPATEGGDSATTVYDALTEVARTRVTRGGGETDTEMLRRLAAPALARELLQIELPWVRSEPREVDGKLLARLETGFAVLDPDVDGLDQIAPRALPQNWPLVNSFFCSLTQITDGDFRAPGIIGTLPTAAMPSWRAVFQECVGDCPSDWFPNTFLVFTWERSESQLVLTYDLARPLPPDARITIDEGYIQIDQLADRYEVTTVKHILFRDPPFPGGGQALAEFAPTFGWLDHAINWFSDSPSGSAARPQGVPLAPAVAGQDAHLQAVLDDCERDGQELLADVDEQVGSSLAKIKAGTYGLNDYVGDWARATDRAITAGARSLSHQIALGKGWLDLAKTLTGREDKA